MLTRYMPKVVRRDFNAAWENPFEFSAFRFPSDHGFKVDVSEDEKNIYLEADLVGVKKEDISVKIEGDTLVIKAERKSEKVDEGRKYYRKERMYGSMLRSFIIGEDVDSEAIEAKYEDGVLKLTLPKTEDKNYLKKIEVK